MSALDSLGLVKTFLAYMLTAELLRGTYLARVGAELTHRYSVSDTALFA